MTTCGIAFDVSNPLAARYAQEQAATLVAEMSAESRRAARAILSRCWTEGVTPQQAAQLLRTTVTLSERQVSAVLNLRNALVSHPGGIVKAGRVRIRVPKRGMTEAELAKQMNRYAARLLRRRATAIARTETMTAANEGQRQLWRQARDNGILARDAEREWVAGFDDRLCPTCESLHGEKASLDGEYPGGYNGPPAHVMCRCTEAIRLPKEAKGEWQ